MHKKTLLQISEKIKANWPTSWSKIGGASADTRKAFQDECAENNRIPALVVLYMILAMEFLMLMIYVMNICFIKKGNFFPQYIYMYTSMIIAGVCFLVLFSAAKHSADKLMRLETALVAVVGVWSALFSAFDVMNGFSSYLFIQLMIINSLIFRIHPVRHCAINAASYFIYTAVVLSARLSIVVTFAELVNPFFMVAAACIILILNNRTKFRSYINQKLIQEQNKKLEFYANNDYLTKIPNRKSIIEYMDEMIAKGHRNVICMMIDIDNFKLYNDTYGHVTGDSCLIKLACAMDKFVLLQGGRVGRYGGEEFLAVLSGKPEAEAVSIANELVRLVREQNIEFSTNPAFQVVTISVGVCIQRDKPIMDRVAMLISADHALYKAKSEGRNRISVACQ